MNQLGSKFTLQQIAAAAYLKTVEKYGVSAVDPLRLPKSIISLAKANGLEPTFEEVSKICRRVIGCPPTSAPQLCDKDRRKPPLKAPVNALMRLAPSPSKSAHLGHLYLIALHKIMLKNQPTARCILRFEDTDTSPGRSPRAQSVMSFALAASWLRFEPSATYFASTRVDQHLKWLTPHVEGDLGLVLKGRKGVLFLRNRPVFRPGKAVHPLSTRYSWPIYHVQNVIDDHLDGVNYILRGTDLRPSHQFHEQLRRLLFKEGMPRVDYVGRLASKEGPVLKGRRLSHVDYISAGHARRVWRRLRTKQLTPQRLRLLGHEYRQRVLRGPFTGNCTIETLVRLRLDGAQFLKLIEDLRFSQNTRIYDDRFNRCFRPRQASSLPMGTRTLVARELFTLRTYWVKTVRKKELRRQHWYCDADGWYIAIGKTIWFLPKKYRDK